MQFSTASKRTNQDSTTGVFVALYLILLAFFIILTKDLSFSDYKKTVAMRSIGETFGRPKDQDVIFGRLDNIKLDDYALQIEAIVKEYGEVSVNNNEDKLKITLPLDSIYFADEENFRSNRVDDMMQLTALLKNWIENEKLKISVLASETAFSQDTGRLAFFENRLNLSESNIGMKIDNLATLEITIDRDL